MTSPGPSDLSFDLATMSKLLDGEHAAVRRQVRGILSRPSFRYLDPIASIAEQRAQAFEWCRELAEEGTGLLAIPKQYGGQDDFAAFIAAFETIAFHDLSLTIKFTVQFGIWLGSVLLLGNARQHAELLHQIGTFELPGCFAMTEIGHGSNVRELETTATYDPATEEFVIHSPTWTAGKNYIGNGASHGRLATVFAQLKTANEVQGVHAFLVPLRGDTGTVLPGVRIEDNGPKMGENGVDNARIWFDQVRVPRAALLDRFGSVAADGTYQSGIRSAGARFFATISALVGGRISIAAAGLSAAKSGLTIAVKYATRRRQFRAPGQELQSALLDYPTHQRRLLPLVANAYALDFAHKYLVRRRVETQAGDDLAGTREVELLAAGLKAYTTWNTTRTLQTCRECCGGEGYISVNRLPALKADSDIFTTFEGDNTVLMLWIGRQLLADADRVGGPVPQPLPEMAKVLVAAVDQRRTNDEEVSRLWMEHFVREYTEHWKMPEPTSNRPRSFSALFTQRATETIEEIRVFLQVLAGEGVAGHAAMTRQQTALLQAAHAYIERIILEQFIVVISAQDPIDGLGQILRPLCELFALSLVEQHRAWYVERNLIPSGMSRALGYQIDSLCAELVPYAEALVDAFGIPAQCLAAPIAGV